MSERQVLRMVRLEQACGTGFLIGVALTLGLFAIAAGLAAFEVFGPGVPHGTGAIVSGSTVLIVLADGALAVSAELLRSRLKQWLIEDLLLNPPLWMQRSAADGRALPPERSWVVGEVEQYHLDRLSHMIGEQLKRRRK